MRLHHLSHVAAPWSSPLAGAEQFSDLKQFVENPGEGLRGRVEPMPEVRQFEPFAYNAFDLAAILSSRARPLPIREVPGAANAPDLNRRKEALEAFPLESLQMVGTLEQKQVRWALIKTPDSNLYRVK